MTPLNLTKILHEKCREVLLACNEFDSPELLEALFEPNEVLRPHAKDLPKAKSKRDLVDMMIAFLLRVSSSRNDPPLIVFLMVLRDRRGEGDGLITEFDQLIEGIHNANPSIKSRNSQARRARKESQEWEDVIRERKENADQPIDSSVPRTAEDWFAAAGDDLDEWTLRIALAVFNGTSYDVIDDARKSLFKLLEPPPPPPPPPPKPGDPPPPAPPPPPAIPVRKGDRLRKAFAKEEQVSPEKPKVILLENPRLAEEALNYIWADFEDWHQQIAKWLTDYATSHPVDVRTRVAVALGVLLTTDYAVVRKCILFPWASSEEDRAAEFRAAVGKALAFLMTQENSKSIWLKEIERLLGDWSNSGHLALRWTAARAYVYVGEYFSPTSKVIDQWKKIAASEDEEVKVEVFDGLYLTLTNPLHLSLGDAMVTFFWNMVEKPSVEALPILTGCLEGLKNWVDSVGKDLQVSNPGLEMFVILTKIYKPLETAEDTWPPILLDLIDEKDLDSPYRKVLAWLFNRALRHPEMIQDTIDQFRYWLKWIDDAKHPGHRLYEERFIAILQDIIRDDPAGGRMHDRFTYYLQTWAEHTNSKLRIPTAQRVLNRLQVATIPKPN